MLRALSSVRGRTIAGFGFLVLILAAVAAGSAWQVHQHQSDTAAMEEHADTAFVLQNGLVKVESVASALQRYVAVGDETQVAGDETLVPEMRSDMAEAKGNLEQALADAERRGDRKQAATLYQISAEADSLIAGVEIIIGLRQSGDAQTAAAALEATVLPFREFEGKLKAAAETELQEVSALRSRADRAGDLALWLLIISGATGAVLGLATSVLVARSIIKPLSSLEETAIAVSQGDLEARTQAIGPRELANLGAALNQMTESLLDASKRRELEEALRESEERLHTVVAGTPIILFALDREGVFTLSAGKGLEALGLKPGQVVGQSVFDVFRDMPKIQEKFRRALAGEPLTGIMEVGGLAFETIYTPLRGQSGEISGVIGVATDITERKRAEEAVRESEERYRALFEQAADSIALIDTDTGELVQFNDRTHETLGYSRQEFQKLKIPDFEVIESAEEVGKHFEKILSAGTDTFETKHRKKGGELLDIEVRAKAISVGGRDLIQAIFRDITERKRADEALRESEKRFRDITEHAAEWVWEVDASGKYTYASPVVERILGYKPEEVLGKHFYDLFHPEDRKELKKGALGVFAQKQAFSDFTNRNIRKDGSVVWLSTSGVPVLDEQGNLLGYRGVDTDITERKRADEALRESEERYRDLFENANDIVYSYTFNPLGKIISLNKAGERVTGYTLEELSKLNITQLAPPEYHERAAEGLRRQFAGEGPTTTELEITAKDGRKVSLEISPRLIVEDGKPVAVHAIARDVTERQRQEEALQESERKFRTLAETTAAATFIYQGPRICYVNSAAEALTGYTRAEMVEMNFWDVIASGSRKLALERAMARQKGEDVPPRYEVKIVTKDGDERWVDFMAGNVEFDGKPAVLGTAFDITERKRAEETIRHMAHHDALTDLPNRTLFQDRLTMALAQARRKNRMLAVLFLDLDQFKVVNDTVGHAEGDKLLQGVAERLASLVREGDTVARVGGDEFILLLSEASQVEDAAQVAERVLEELRQPWRLQGHEFHVTTSIGIALYPGDGENAESLLRNADTAMYRAKEHGRDNFQLYTPAMNARIVERLALESSLRRGLEREEFVVYYQPQVDIRTEQVVGVEALVRWQHPGRGLVLPAEFIPVAEETGLIVPLGEWVLSTACAQNKAWQEAGLPPMRVAVNLSARQFQQRDLTDVVAKVLQDTGLSPHLLQIEITEGIAMQDVDFTIATLQGLREMGVQISIDDFGTGYSSLAYLKRFPIDAVKIDRSFVCDLVVDPNDAAIATTVITMAHNLNLNVIAEGVETEEQLAFLDQQQCDEIQGFLFSRPVPAAVLEKIVRTDGARLAARTGIDSA